MATVRDAQERWLVTGSTGFLGSNAPRYLSSGLELIAASRTGVRVPGYGEAISLDLTDVSAARAAIASARPTVILHSAALAEHEKCESDPALAHRVNAVATRELAALAEAIGARFVYISTDAVFDGSKGGYLETDPVSPFSVYGETKLGGETAALAETAALVLRTNFFGWSPSGTRSILEFFVGSLTNRNPVRGYTDFTVTSIYAGDLLERIELLVGTGESGIFHLASRDALSKFAFGTCVAEVFDLDGDLITPQSAAAGTHATSRVRNLSLNTELVARTLGHSMPSQGEGIRRARAERAG
ncbi:MAG: SDR family oxidoreductase [Actinomycetes bacterium]